jgi:hypothetical protein
LTNLYLFGIIFLKKELRSMKEIVEKGQDLRSLEKEMRVVDYFLSKKKVMGKVSPSSQISYARDLLSLVQGDEKRAFLLIDLATKYFQHIGRHSRASKPKSLSFVVDFAKTLDPQILSSSKRLRELLSAARDFAKATLEEYRAKKSEETIRKMEEMEKEGSDPEVAKLYLSRIKELLRS